MNHDTTMRAALQAAKLRQEFIDWLRADADKLVSAAQLLGGQRWEDRAISVIDAIDFGVEPEELEADLAKLHRLMTLEYIDDLNGDEALYFIAVHPDDPGVEDTRLCAEGLERGLQVLRAHAAALNQEVS